MTASFAVAREEWEESPEFDKLVKDRMAHQEEREQAFLSHKGDCFAIYQVKAHRRAAGHPPRGPGMAPVHRADGAAETTMSWFIPPRCSPLI